MERQFFTVGNMRMVELVATHFEKYGIWEKKAEGTWAITLSIWNVTCCRMKLLPPVFLLQKESTLTPNILSQLFLLFIHPRPDVSFEDFLFSQTADTNCTFTPTNVGKPMNNEIHETNCIVPSFN